MLVSAISAFNDNYIWALQPQHGAPAIVVDPGDDQPVREWLRQQDVPLAGILITHHHWDHINGVLPLLRDYSIPVYGPRNPNIQGITHPLEHGTRFTPPSLGRDFQVLETPGHTLDHICFYTPGYLFCGDTLFSAGCGRMFEGTADVFYRSLQSLAELPPETNVYCTHEYTLANIKFARVAEPENQRLIEYEQQVKALREQGLITLPSSIELELAVNPFMRAKNTDDFARLRQWKDNF